MDIERYKQRLLELERKLSFRLGHELANARETRDDQPGHGDRAMVDETRAEYFILAETDAEILDQVRAALRRIELGIYGICVVDVCPIDEQRLNAVPWTPYCRKHQQMLEEARGIRTPTL
jgi:DnaK suppressor protein